MSIDYLTDKELEHLNVNQKKIYRQFEKKSALRKYNRLCMLDRICPKCGSDLNNNNACYTCDSQFSMVGKEIPIDCTGGRGH